MKSKLVNIYYKTKGDGKDLADLDTYSGIFSAQATVSEGHDTVSEVTKFPVQSGFEISNHSIRKNRKVSLDLIMSNVVLAGTLVTEDKHGSSYIKIAYDLINTLVRERIPCIIRTNLGEYSPVILTSFKTKQGVGSMDSLNMVLQGEEVILASGVNKTGPSELSFVRVPDAEWQGYRDKLACQGIHALDDDEISTAKLDANDSGFATGALTFINEGMDIFGKASFESHKTDYDVFGTKEAVDRYNQFYKPPEEDGFSMGTCIADAVEDAATTFVGDYVETALGPLEKSLYGAKTDIINIGGDAVAPLLSDGLDCIVALAADNILDTEVDDCGQPIPRNKGDLPTANDIIGGISDAGAAASQTLVKITRGKL